MKVTKKQKLIGKQKRRRKRHYTKPAHNPSWFEKGNSASPGRPRLTPEQIKDRASFRQACRDRSPRAMEVIEELMDHADRDSVRMSAASYLVDHGFGAPANRTELTGENGAPIQTQDVPLTEEELVAELTRRGLPLVLLTSGVADVEPASTT